ncbi:MAG: protein-glutamate O-methyltransferase, partial [Pseudomonadota bacterium]|nr:protein-glutamate O-methyltransferase [Pseudomonadota bacterium]
MKIADFDLYKDLLYERSGLDITPDKSYLLDSRLTPIAKKWGYHSLEAMSVSLRALPDPELVKEIVDAMTTNETSFYRDIRPFENFENVVLPYIIENAQRGKTLRIWCAACSTGQEPYSLAMILKEKQAELGGRRIEIVATDISDRVLNTARQGIYSQFEVQRGLPVTKLVRFFKQVEDKWQINDEIKAMVNYRNFNLLDSMASLGKFDVVLCRNVLIYFDTKTKAKVLEGISNQMEQDGFLFLGGAETVLGVTDTFSSIKDVRGLYAKTGQHGTVAKT